MSKTPIEVVFAAMATSPQYCALIDTLRSGGRVWLDAGTGTELQARGVAMHPGVWCGVAHLSDPEAALAVHADYIRAGADVVTANTFSANRLMMGPAGLGDSVEESVTRAVGLAQEARDLVGANRPVVVAASMSHQVPLEEGSTRRKPNAVPDLDLTQVLFEEMADLISAAGADMILLEMMYQPDLARRTIEAALGTKLPVWLGMSAKLNEAGELVAYNDPDLSFDALCAELIDGRFDVVGIMHSSVNAIRPAIETIRRHWSGPVMAYPDSGHFTMPDWHFEEAIAPGPFAVEARAWAAAGAQVLGGCCGLGVEHIQSLLDAAPSW